MAVYCFPSRWHIFQSQQRQRGDIGSEQKGEQPRKIMRINTNQEVHKLETRSPEFTMPGERDFFVTGQLH